MAEKLQRATRGDLTQYDPQRGLKSIAVAEAAEKHFARAKDAAGLNQAIEKKLELQAEFIQWWDSNGLDQPGRPSKKKPNGFVRNTRAGRDGMPDSMTLSRWRPLKDAAKFEARKQRYQAKCLKVIEQTPGAHVGGNTGEHEWYTPAEYIEAARRVLGGIDLDPASSDAANEIVQAGQIFTAIDSGLDQSWHGRVWMNPPYSQPLIEHFCEKFAQHAERGDITGIVLVNNATETAWFQRLASASRCLCFPKGRIKFWSPRGDSALPLQGQAVLYTGADTVTFSAAFRSFGFIVERTA